MTATNQSTQMTALKKESGSSWEGEREAHTQTDKRKEVTVP
jgi:hypothetical protein